MGTLRNVLIGILVFSFITSSLVFFYSDKEGGGLSHQYATQNITLTEQYDRFNRNDSIRDLEQNISRELKDIETQTGEADDNLIKGAYNVLRLSWNSIGHIDNIFGALLNEETSGIPFPSFVKPMIMTLITIIIAFAIISAIFRKET